MWYINTNVYTQLPSVHKTPIVSTVYEARAMRSSGSNDSRVYNYFYNVWSWEIFVLRSKIIHSHDGLAEVHQSLFHSIRH